MAIVAMFIEGRGSGRVFSEQSLRIASRFH